MTSQTSPVTSQNAPSPEPIFDLATGFMRAKHLFVAGELGIFEKLADGPAILGELATRLGTPLRTTRIIADAVTALGLLERHGEKYQNSEVAQAYLSGRGCTDMRPFIRFWNRLSYKRWLTLEDSIRKGQGVAGEFNFTAEEQKIFSEGVESFSAGHALALAAAYDFSRHRRVLDLGGGTGSFLKVLLQRYPQLQCTLYELPTAAAVAGQRLIRWGRTSTSWKATFSRTPCQKATMRSCWLTWCTCLYRSAIWSYSVARGRLLLKVRACSLSISGRTLRTRSR